jgi:hypothetical protein
VYFPPLPANVDDLQASITDAVADVTPGMLHCTWEKNHKWDVTLHLEITLNCNSDVSEKNLMCLVFIYHLLINVYILSKL